MGHGRPGAPGADRLLLGDELPGQLPAVATRGPRPGRDAPGSSSGLLFYEKSLLVIGTMAIITVAYFTQGSARERLRTVVARLPALGPGQRRARGGVPGALRPLRAQLRPGTGHPHPDRADRGRDGAALLGHRDLRWSRCGGTTRPAPPSRSRSPPSLLVLVLRRRVHPGVPRARPVADGVDAGPAAPGVLPGLRRAARRGRPVVVDRADHRLRVPLHQRAVGGDRRGARLRDACRSEGPSSRSSRVGRASCSTAGVRRRSPAWSWPSSAPARRRPTTGTGSATSRARPSSRPWSPTAGSCPGAPPSSTARCRPTCCGPWRTPTTRSASCCGRSTPASATRRQATDRLALLGPDGHLGQLDVTPVHQALPAHRTPTAPTGSGTASAGSSSTARSLFGGWWVKVGYIATADSSITVSAGGLTQQASVSSGLHTLYFKAGDERFDSITLGGLIGEATLCTERRHGRPCDSGGTIMSRPRPHLPDAERRPRHRGADGGHHPRRVQHRPDPARLARRRAGPARLRGPAVLRALGLPAVAALLPGDRPR